MNARTPNLLVIVGLAVILAPLAAGFAWFWHVSRTLDERHAQRLELSQQTALQTQQLADITRRAQLIESQVRDYDRLVPDAKGLGSFLGQLSGQLDAAGLHDTAVRALAPTLLGKCERLPIEVRGMGTYQQVHSFLQHLESMERKSSISRLQIETADPTMTGSVVMDLTLSIYSTQQE